MKDNLWLLNRFIASHSFVRSFVRSFFAGSLDVTAEGKNFRSPDNLSRELYIMNLFYTWIHKFDVEIEHTLYFLYFLPLVLIFDGKKFEFPFDFHRFKANLWREKMFDASKSISQRNGHWCAMRWTTLTSNCQINQKRRRTFSNISLIRETFLKDEKKNKRCSCRTIASFELEVWTTSISFCLKQRPDGKSSLKRFVSLWLQMFVWNWKVF